MTTPSKGPDLQTVVLGIAEALSEGRSVEAALAVGERLLRRVAWETSQQEETTTVPEKAWAVKEPDGSSAPIDEKPPIQAHSKSEYRRLVEQGANVLPPVTRGEATAGGQSAEVKGEQSARRVVAGATGRGQSDSTAVEAASKTGVSDAPAAALPVPSEQIIEIDEQGHVTSKFGQTVPSELWRRVDRALATFDWTPTKVSAFVRRDHYDDLLAALDRLRADASGERA